MNAWLRVAQAEALGRGAPEFFLFDAQIAPWTPADSLAVQKLMALQLTDKAARETLRAQLTLRLPPERVRDLMPDAPNAPVMGLPGFGAALPAAPARSGRRRGIRSTRSRRSGAPARRTPSPPPGSAPRAARRCSRPTRTWR